MATEIDWAKLAGILIGAGHFGGDGRQPQVTVRMHIRHESLFLWMQQTFPGGRLYGPYDHSGRQYYQWMARGTFLRDELVPAMRQLLTPQFDLYGHGRFEAMCERYRSRLSPVIEDPHADHEGVSP